MSSPVKAADGSSKQAELRGISAICCDMDGTFLNNQHEAPLECLSAVKDVETLGCHVIFSTGRPRIGAQAKLPGIDLGCRGGVYLNGAVAFGKDGNILHERTVPRDVVLKVLEHFGSKSPSAEPQDRPFTVVLCRGDHHYVADRREKWALYLYENYADPDPVDLGGREATLEKYLPDDCELPHIIHIVGSKDDLDAERDSIAAIVGSAGKVKRALPNQLTVVALGCSKADGLQAVFNELQCTADEAIAMGDAENDLEMLKFVRIGIAMGNAMDSVKDAAAWTCPSNEDSPPGVAQVIQAVAQCARGVNPEHSLAATWPRGGLGAPDPVAAEIHTAR